MSGAKVCTAIRWRGRGSSRAVVAILVAWTFKRFATRAASLPCTACSERPCLLFFWNPFFFLLPSCESNLLVTSTLSGGRDSQWLGLVNIRSVFFQLCQWTRGVAGGERGNGQGNSWWRKPGKKGEDCRSLFQVSVLCHLFLSTNLLLSLSLVQQTRYRHTHRATGWQLTDRQKGRRQAK